MLDNDIIKKIEGFVYSKPRSIQEIAKEIEKSWRTADRYVEEIEKEFGTITTRTFREGTRGALKIVYWASVEKASNSAFQEKLQKEIEILKNKNDFSAFDIFQHVDEKKKDVSIQQADKEEKTDFLELAGLLESTKKQFLSFSGNLSWVEYKDKKIDLFSITEKLVKRGVSIKMLARIDLASIDHVQRLLSLNFKYGKECIEIRHVKQPIRGLVIDNKIARLKEIEEPTNKAHELNKKTFIFYTIKDKEWVEWLSRIFWKMFSSSIDARRRINEMKKIKLK